MARPDLVARPLYDTTYSLYRLSPLHLARTTDAAAFHRSCGLHARRLAEHLQRDTQLGLGVPGLGGLVEDNDALARAGRLQRTVWTWLSAAEEGSEHDVEAGAEPEARDQHRETKGGADGLGLTEGLRITLEFEHLNYAALILRRTAPTTQARTETAASAPSDNQALHLPVLLLRMPTVLRQSLCSYLAAHFDARADLVHLPAPALASALEAYLRVLAPGSDGRADNVNADDEDDAQSDRVTKDVQLTLAFRGPELRSLDVAVQAHDVAGFVRRGVREVERERPAASAAGAKPSTAGNPTPAASRGIAAGPFTRALAQYLRTHLALDCAHADVGLARVACGGFALGREGRVKVFHPPPSGEWDEAQEVVGGLLEVIWGVVDSVERSESGLDGE